MATINTVTPSIFEKTPQAIAKAAQDKEIKTKVLNVVVTDTKPASLGVGEVAKVVTPAVTDANGKVTTKATTAYYTGTADGKLSKPLKSVSSVIDATNTQISKAEKIQAAALRTSQKIELAETKQALTAAGLPKSEISSIIKAESKANAAEYTQLEGLLNAPSLQYGVRDPETNTFVNNAVNGVTTKSALPTSLLNYNDPVIAPTIQNNIKTANNAVAEFQILKGITQPFIPGGNSSSGLNPYDIYRALDNGSIIANKDTNGNTTGYKVSPEVAAANGDQSGFMDATGMSKSSARSLGLVLNNDAIIGGKANVVKDDKGNYFVRDASGIDRYGTQKPLVDTGQTDDKGNKIFAELSTDNSKRNLVSVVSNYVQDKNGAFTYGGVADTSYKHLEGFNPIKALVIAGMTAGAGMATGPLTGLTGTLGNTVTGAVAGAVGSGLAGNNILKGGLLGALGGFTIGELTKMANEAGGWDAFYNKIGLDNFSLPTPEATVTDTASLGNTIDAGTDLTNYGTTGTTGLGANMTYNTSAVGQGIKLGLDASGNVIDMATKMPFTQAGINFAKDAAGNFILDAAGNVLDAATNLPFKGEGVNLINFDTGNYVQPQANIDGGGLLDNVTDFVTDNPLTTAAIAGTTVIPEVIKALTPTPTTPTYTAPLINNALFPTNDVTDWNSYYNNLFKRQGVGAGNYLGYDFMNKLGDIPPELMGLLGTSAQANTGVTSGQTTGVP
jgi:hypothetical protein